MCFKARWLSLLFFFFLAIQSLNCQSLLFEDIYYKEILPQKLQSKNTGGNYRSVYYLPLTQTHLFSPHPIVQSLRYLTIGSLAQTHIQNQDQWAPFLAKSIEKETREKKIVYRVSLQENLYWQPLHFSTNIPSFFLKKTNVTSRDFALTVKILQNPYYDEPYVQKLKTKYAWVESIEIIDDHCFEVQTSHDVHQKEEEALFELFPLPSSIFCRDKEGRVLFNDKEDISLSSAYAEALKEHWALNFFFSCGPFKVKEAKANEVILVKNEEFPLPYRALFDQMTFSLKGSTTAAWQAFKAMEVDSHFLTPFQYQDYQKFLGSKVYERQKKQGNSLEKYEFLAPLYYFIGWNQKHTFFRDKKIREAFSYAIPYEKILQEFLKGFAQRLTGPFMPQSPYYDDSLPLYPFDLKKAYALLQEQGFEKDPKTGLLQHVSSKEPFRFKLLYYRQNEVAHLICQCISMTLKELGIECQLEAENYEGFLQKASTHLFDALFMAWPLEHPLENLEEIWSSSASLNFIQFEHDQVDDLIKKLQEKEGSKEEKAKAIHRLLYEEQPYTFLYLPKQVFVYRSYLKNVSLFDEKTGNHKPCPRVFYFSSEPDETLSSL